MVDIIEWNVRHLGLIIISVLSWECITTGMNDECGANYAWRVNSLSVVIMRCVVALQEVESCILAGTNDIARE